MSPPRLDEAGEKLGEVELADFNRALAVNTAGPLLGIQAPAPLMPAGSAPVFVRAHST
ncbi:hypothetical protein ACWC2T_13095 [Streptomyces sp. NPDC001393]